MPKIVNCIICNSKVITPYSATFKEGFPHILRTKCHDCGAVFANPVATEEELFRFYDNYYEKGNFGREKYKERISKAIIELKNRKVSEISKKEIVNFYLQNLVATANVLEVGFGLGYGLALANKCGHNIYGTEYDKAAIDFFSGYYPNSKLFHGDLLNANYADNLFNHVILIHVIEHILNPLQYIKELNRIVKPGGTIVVTTPLINARIYTLYRFCMFLMCKIPGIIDGVEHTIVFNKKLLRTVFEQNGFNIVKHVIESDPYKYKDIILDKRLSLNKKFIKLLQCSFSINQRLVCIKK